LPLTRGIQPKWLDKTAIEKEFADTLAQLGSRGLSLSNNAKKELLRQAKAALESDNLVKFNSLMAVLGGQERLDFHHAVLGDDGAAMIAKALESPNSAVNEVDLRNNQLGPDGATAIGKALQSPDCKVTEMILNSNNLGPTGATSIAEALATKDCKVRVMYLIDNKIGDDGAEAMAKALEKALPKEKKMEICLRENGIGEAGRNALQQAVKNKNIELPRLDIQ